MSHLSCKTSQQWQAARCQQQSLYAKERLCSVQSLVADIRYIRTTFLETQACSSGFWIIHPTTPFARLDAFPKGCMDVCQIARAAALWDGGGGV